ncbi:MAG: MiaB/RimO family radical SAM methylthiotransferase [Chloroflexota bacterium]
MKIYLDTVGCRLNQSEIETYARQFHVAGHVLVSGAAEADVVVLNTCAVTTEAASDSRQKIRQAARSGAEGIVVTGCWSTLHPQDAAALSGVRRVVSNADKDRLVADVLGIPVEQFALEPVERIAVPGLRLRTRAFIKAQDGCDNRCAFCVTTVARGAGRSRSIPDVLADINAAAQSGVQEIVLTGVHLGSWGHDFAVPRHLADLVQAVLQETDVPRVRLSSLEPWDLSPNFFALWQNPRLCRHLHLPLQSGCAATLKRMARKTTPESFAALVAAARAAIPEVAITTDIIVGFPGESDEEFAASAAFVRQMDFADGHVFSYSARPGTAAARMKPQVPHPLRKARNAELRQVLAESAVRYRAHFAGCELPVLWESATALGPGGWELSGLTDNYLRVSATAAQDYWNQVTPVSLTGMAPGGLTGVLNAPVPPVSVRNDTFTGQNGTKTG